MEKEFVTYDQALALKELGFDEPCLAFWDGKNTDAFYFNNIRDASGDYVPFQKHDRLKWFGAPLKQQVFRWFREKYGYWSYIKEATKGTCRFNIEKFDEKFFNSGLFGSYEDAESACIDKLIEMVKKK